MAFSAADYRLMARTFRLRAADERRMAEIDRLIGSAHRYEALARLADEDEKAAARARAARGSLSFWGKTPPGELPPDVRARA